MCKSRLRYRLPDVGSPCVFSGCTIGPHLPSSPPTPGVAPLRSRLLQNLRIDWPHVHRTFKKGRSPMRSVAPSVGPTETCTGSRSTPNVRRRRFANYNILFSWAQTHCDNSWAQLTNSAPLTSNASAFARWVATHALASIDIHDHSPARPYPHAQTNPRPKVARQRCQISPVLLIQTGRL